MTKCAGSVLVFSLTLQFGANGFPIGNGNNFAAEKNFRSTSTTTGHKHRLLLLLLLVVEKIIARHKLSQIRIFVKPTESEKIGFLEDGVTIFDECLKGF